MSPLRWVLVAHHFGFLASSPFGVECVCDYHMMHAPLCICLHQELAVPFVHEGGVMDEAEPGCKGNGFLEPGCSLSGLILQNQHLTLKSQFVMLDIGIPFLGVVVQFCHIFFRMFLVCFLLGSFIGVNQGYSHVVRDTIGWWITWILLVYVVSKLNSMTCSQRIVPKNGIQKSTYPIKDTWTRTGEKGIICVRCFGLSTLA